MVGQNEYYIGVDLGGTSIKHAIIREDGTLLKKREIATPVEEGGEAIMQAIASAAVHIADETGVDYERIKGIGIGVPGFMNIPEGIVHEAVNLGLLNFPVKAQLEAQSQRPVFVDNDANIAALGEMWQGAGQGARHLICVTLGTGVGGGIIANGDIYHGADGIAGEIGHVTAVAKNGEPCNCGRQGCLEVYASATAIAREGLAAAKSGDSVYLQDVWNKTDDVTAKDVAEGALQNDEACGRIVNDVGYYLGLSLAQLSNSLNPQKIVIGGGVSQAGAILFDPIQHHFDHYALKLVRQSAEILPAQLGNDAGVYGAAWLAKHRN